ncbi:MAG: hypothetical protein LRY73_11665 [Bacillus sp. (in: Bacteria)]|nr:hypothetical protein [Bacillus sp. (in: firmicutes)]
MGKIKKFSAIMVIAGFFFIVYGLLPTPFGGYGMHLGDMKYIANRYTFIGVGGTFIVVGYVLEKLVKEIKEEILFMTGKISDLEEKIKRLEEEREQK